MAVPTNAVRQRLFQESLGWLRRENAEGRNPTASEIAQHVRNTPDNLTRPYGATTYQALARRAVEAYRLANQLQDDAFRRPRAAEIPGDVGLQPDAPRFLYSYVVRVRKEGHPEVSWRVDLESDTLLSYIEVSSHARDNIEQEISPRNKTRAKYAAVRAGAEVDVFLVSVVKR